MTFKKIIIICIAFMILTPSFSFAFEAEPSSSSSDSSSAFDSFPSENNKAGKSDALTEISDNYDVLNLEEINLDTLLQEENFENPDSFEEIMSMAAGITTVEPDADLSSLTAIQSADFSFSNDAYLTSLFSGAAVIPIRLMFRKESRVFSLELR